MPRLTVLLSSFNRPRRLLRAATSVLTQSFRDLQLVVLDDNSPRRDVSELIDALTQSDSRCTLIKSDWEPHHKSQLCTFGQMINAGLDATDSELVSYVCDSAEWLRQRTERLVARLDAQPVCDIAFDRQHYVREDAQGNVVFREDREEDLVAVEIWQGQALVERLAPRNHYDHNGCVERRCAVRWSERASDWFFLDWVRWREMAGRGMRFDVTGRVGEVKRVGPDSTGMMMGGGMTIAQVVAARGDQCHG